MRGLGNHISILFSYMNKQTLESSKQINLFAIVMLINFPVFGLVWRVEAILLKEEYILRVTATCLCALLFSTRFWPSSLLKCLPLLWYVTLLFCLPFFFSYLTLLHNCSTIWLMNCVSAIFLLLLVTRVMDALILMFLGFGLAFTSYFLGEHTLSYIPGEISLFSLSMTFAAAVIIGALFARDREISHADKISGMRLLAGSLAHDLRTSLASIHLQAELQDMIINKLKNPAIQKDLKRSLSKINRGIELGNQLISMQLNNIQHEKFDTTRFTIQPVSNLMVRTLQEYPFRKEQRKLLRVDLQSDFLVWIEEVAFKNLIWNLLKNSMDYIDETGKGDVEIWLTQGDKNDDFNYLNFKDTAKGIYPKQAAKIFDSFYSDRKGGTGVGLAYCKLLMKAAGGDIYCQGKSNEFAHFTLKFPKID
ncbi:sensor histidine kinase [Legionella septentrionalis]|uniref:histidine kinase n=1 Tax=Legionella septentrionalis TaxID=2498109 RepID=A0A3S0X1B7_9GAMM|nr:HAMP domain-containing histidine kinase [Legionella septentrionalis]RUQ99533.1 HAMP domain-containing histidine kinase [Legionella septentrionalis]RUR14440.1 HAMP domain-containing histidine kinase [Legionella septentrionalis]